MHVQYSRYCSQHAKQFEMNIPPLKSKVMSYKGQVPIRSKIVTSHNTGTSKHVHIFGMRDFIEQTMDVTSKMSKLLQILGFLINEFKSDLVQRHSQLNRIFKFTVSYCMYCC
jgi:hypothetical protein